MDVVSKLLSELENHKCYQSIHRPFILRQKYSVWGYCRRLKTQYIPRSTQSIIIQFYIKPHFNINDIINKGILKHCNDTMSYSTLYHLLTTPFSSEQNALLHIILELNSNHLFMKTLADDISLTLRWTRNIKRLQSSLLHQETDEESSSCYKVPQTYNNNAYDEYQYSSSSESSYHTQFQTPKAPSKVSLNQPIVHDVHSSDSESLSEEYAQSRTNTISDIKACDKCTFHNHLRARKCKICGHKLIQKKKKQKKKKKEKKQNNNKKHRNRNRKPKWWRCGGCSVRNTKLTARCSCGQKQPLQRYQWMCTQCTATNHVNNDKCIVCLQERKYQCKGDWSCKACYNINTLDDMVCGVCKGPKVNVAKKKAKHNKKKWNKYESVRVVIGSKYHNNNYNNDRVYNNNKGYNAAYNDYQNDGYQRNRNSDRYQGRNSDRYQRNGEQWSEHVAKYKAPKQENEDEYYNDTQFNHYRSNNYYQNQAPPSSHSSDHRSIPPYHNNYNGSYKHRPSPPPNDRYLQVGDVVVFNGIQVTIKNIVGEYCRVENREKKLSNALLNQLRLCNTNNLM